MSLEGVVLPCPLCMCSQYIHKPHLSVSCMASTPVVIQSQDCKVLHASQGRPWNALNRQLIVAQPETLEG